MVAAQPDCSETRTEARCTLSHTSKRTRLRSTSRSTLPRFDHDGAHPEASVKAPRVKSGKHCEPAKTRSVDCWPMAIDTASHSGRGPVWYPSQRRDHPRVRSS